jgi:RNA polymerase sigma-70 factor (ECF subfamily)
VSAPAAEAWSQRLEARWAQARAQWPTLPSTFDEFERLVRARLPEAGAEQLERLHTSDLLLCATCARGNPVALGLLEEHFFKPLGRALSRQHGLATADEALQRLRTRLLVGGGNPRLATYSGAGPLKQWLKTAAVREVIRLERQPALLAEPDLDALERLAADATPEFDLAHAQNRALFRATLSSVLGQLSPPERALLRRYFVDRQSIDVLAHEWGAHRATMARRLSKLRTHLHEVLERELAVRFKASDSALGSVLRAFRAQLDVTLERYLC